MAIYKIFPEKSATLYSFYPTLNTGLDEILEISTFESINSTDEVSRALIKFPTNQISESLAKATGKAFDVYLKLYLANASSIPLNYTLFAHPIATDWNKGTGRLGNSPITTDGAGWQYKDQNSGSAWFSGSFTSGTTGSYASGSNVGGGLWYTSSNYQSTQSFTNLTSKDIELKVTNTVSASYTNVISNYGFILKHSSSLEFTTQSKFETKYFSDNTHTIYPPCLEVRWDDSVYSTGSLSVITSSYVAITINNNKSEYQQDSIQRFRVAVRDLYPTTTFRTSLGFSNQRALPTSSYWAIKDLDTEEMVVDYDTSYTKISCDSNSNYFDVYMNGLEPERYYKLLIKTVLLTKETIVADKDYIFKVIR